MPFPDLLTFALWLEAHGMCLAEICPNALKGNE